MVCLLFHVVVAVTQLPEVVVRLQWFRRLVVDAVVHFDVSSASKFQCEDIGAGDHGHGDIEDAISLNIEDEAFVFLELIDSWSSKTSQQKRCMV